MEIPDKAIDEFNTVGDVVDYIRKTNCCPLIEKGSFRDYSELVLFFLFLFIRILIIIVRNFIENTLCM